MNKQQLKQLLEKERIPERIYSLEGGLPEDRLCIGKDYDGWEIYYVERGEKVSRKVFKTEEEACEYLYNWIKKTMKLMGK